MVLLDMLSKEYGTWCSTICYCIVFNVYGRIGMGWISKKIGFLHFPILLSTVTSTLGYCGCPLPKYLVKEVKCSQFRNCLLQAVPYAVSYGALTQKVVCSSRVTRAEHNWAQWSGEFSFFFFEIGCRDMTNQDPPNKHFELWWQI